MKVSEIMNSELLTVRPDMKVGALEELIADKNVGGIPVVSEDGELRGLISKTDLIRLHARGHNVSSGSTQVWEIMMTDVMTVSPEDDVRDAARIMVENHFHRALVCRGEALVGIVSSFDMMKLVANGSV